MGLISSQHLSIVFRQRTEIVDTALSRLIWHKDEFDAIAVSGYSMALIVPIIAYNLDKNIILIRKHQGDHTDLMIEGYTNQRVLFLDDGIGLGATFKRVEEKLGEFNCKLVAVYFYGWQSTSELPNWSV